MASLRLPDRLRRGLISLSAASDEAVEELHRRLTALTPGMLDEDFSERLSSELTLWNKQDAEDVVSSLIALCLSRANLNRTPDQLVTDVLTSLARLPERLNKDPKELTLSAEHAEPLRGRLLRFLALNTFDVSVKARGVLVDHQRIFVGARILSDVRAVFHEDVSAWPAAAVIAHSLKVEFVEEGARKEFFVALDTKDLQIITDVIQRAQKKDESLRKVLVTANLPFLEPK